MRPKTPAQLRAEAMALNTEALRLENEHAPKTVRPEYAQAMLDQIKIAHDYQEKGNLSRNQEETLVGYILTLERVIEEISAEKALAEEYIRQLTVYDGQ